MYLVKMTKNDEVRQDDQQNGRLGQESPSPPLSLPKHLTLSLVRTSGQP